MHDDDEDEEDKDELVAFGWPLSALLMRWDDSYSSSTPMLMLDVDVGFKFNDDINAVCVLSKFTDEDPSNTFPL